MELKIYLYISSMDSGMESHEKLKTAVAHYLHEMGVPDMETDVSSWNINKNQYGKPYFTDAPWIHFSISHSGVYWACAVSDQPVGLDLQLRRKKGGKNEQHSYRIAQRFFHPDEKRYVENGGEFYDVWTAKESYVKYTGRGIGEGFELFAVADENAVLDQVKCRGDVAPRLKLLTENELGEQFVDYSCCICAACIENVQVRMF